MDVKEIREQRFTVRRKGYQIEEVDAFMDRLITWAEAQDARLAELESLYAQREEQIFRLQEKNVQLAKENAALLERPVSEPQLPQPQNEELKQQMQILLTNAHEVAAKIQRDAQEQAVLTIEQANAAALQREQEADERVRNMNEIITTQTEMLERGRLTFENMREQYAQAYQAMVEKQQRTADQLAELKALTLAVRAEVGGNA